MVDKAVEYKGFSVTLSDADKKQLDKGGCHAGKHWRCVVYDKPNRKQMSFDVFGGSNATATPLKALYQFCNDAYTYACYDDAQEFQHECGIDSYQTARDMWKNLEKAYFKARKFIGSDDDIFEIVRELEEKWG